MGFLSLLAYASLAATAPAISRDVPSQPQASPSPGVGGEIVAVPFDPPLGTPLRYRYERTVSRDRTVRSSWMEFEIAFGRRPQGYRMEVRILDAGAEGDDGEAATAHQRIGELLQRPFALLLDGSGGIEALEDADGWWSEMVRLARETATRSSTAEADPEARNAAENATVEMLEATPSQARLAVMTQPVAPIVEYGDVTLTLGEELALEVEATGMMGLSLLQQVRVRGERVADGALVVSVRMTTPPDEMVRATQQLIEQIMARIPTNSSATDTEAERARALAELRNAEISRQYDGEYSVELHSGLTVSHRSTDRFRMRAGSEATDQTTSVILRRVTEP